MKLWHVRCKLQCYTYIQQKCGQKPKAKSQVKPMPKSQQKPKSKSQVKPKPKSQQKPKTKSQEKPKSKDKGQKPSGHANERLKHKNILKQKNFLKNIPSIEKCSQKPQEAEEATSQKPAKKKTQKKGLKHVFSTLSNSFSLRSSTIIITSHSSPKWTSRDSQQACRISASCIFRSSTSLSWVPDSCHHKGKIQEPPLFDDGKNTCQTDWMRWTNKALLLDLHLNQSPPAWPSWPLWAILIAQRGSWTPQKIDNIPGNLNLVSLAIQIYSSVNLFRYILW